MLSAICSFKFRLVGIFVIPIDSFLTRLLLLCESCCYPNHQGRWPFHFLVHILHKHGKLYLMSIALASLASSDWSLIFQSPLLLMCKWLHAEFLLNYHHCRNTYFVKILAREAVGGHLIEGRPIWEWASSDKSPLTIAFSYLIFSFLSLSVWTVSWKQFLCS